MRSSSWLLVVFVALSATAANAVLAASASQCASVATCYAGGATSTPCTISNGGCPPCVTFADDGCYVQVNGACPFGVDCTSVWAETPASTSSSSSTSSTPTNSGASTTTPSTTDSSPPTTDSAPPTADAAPPATDSLPPATDSLPPATDSLPPATDSSPPTSASGTSDTAGVSSSPTASSTSGSIEPTPGTSSTGSSDMSVVFAIIGAAIGVIAVAVIFLTLVRRSNAAHDEDEDDMTNTPPAFSKGPVVHAPHNTTSAATYSSYNGSNRTPGMDSGNGAEIGLDSSKGVSTNAVSYYNQQPPHNSAAPSPHVAGRAIPSQPVGMNASTGMARPYGGSQNFGVSGVGVTSGFGTSGFGQSGVGVNNQVPLTPVQHLPMGGVAPSPHSRRESYEF